MLLARSSRSGLTLLELIVVLVILLALSTLIVPVLSWIGKRSQAIATRDNLVRLRETIVNRYVVDMGDLPRPRKQLVDNNTRIDHPQLVYLFVNPRYHEDTLGIYNDLQVDTNALGAQRWQGPYVTHSGSEYFVTDTDTDLSTGTNYTSRYGVGTLGTTPETRIGDPTVIDAWGQPIVIQEPILGSTPIPGVTQQIARQYARLVSPGPNGNIDTPPDELMPTLAQRNDDLVLFLFRHDEYGDNHLSVEPE